METPSAIDGARVSSHWNAQLRRGMLYSNWAPKEQKGSCPLIYFVGMHLIEAQGLGNCVA
jgi:hypothetical protein